MKKFGEDRDVLIQKNVRLIQRGHFYDNLDCKNDKDIIGIDDVVNFYYMGSSEFENGNLYRSIRRMTINKDFYKLYIFKQYKDSDGNSLKVYAPSVFFDNIKKIVNRLAVDGSGLQEYCTLCNHIDGNCNLDDCNDQTDFWWDIENDFFMFFENTDKVMSAMDALRKRNFGYENCLAKSALSSFYVLVIKRKNDGGLVNFNTAIKDYYFDGETETHFIEFLENSSLRDIFMEAMVISKVDGGSVIFNINGIQYNITADDFLDSVISESGVNLDDSCIYSENIKKLIDNYNNQAELHNKRRVLVYILNQVKNKKKS